MIACCRIIVISITEWVDVTHLRNVFAFSRCSVSIDFQISLVEFGKNLEHPPVTCCLTVENGLAGLVKVEGLVRLAGFVLVSFDTILMSFLSDVGVILVSSGCLSATLGLPGTPRGGRAEKVAEKVSFGSSPGTFFGSKSTNN